MKKLLLCGSIMLLSAFVGCGKNCSVSGKVTFSDGTPLTRGKVVFESPTLISSGPVQKDGTFQLGTLKPKDGVPPGSYKVCFSDIITPSIKTIPPANGKGPPKVVVTHPESPIDKKYLNAETSGLTCDVKGSMKFDIVVEPPSETKKK